SPSGSATPCSRRPPMAGSRRISAVGTSRATSRPATMGGGARWTSKPVPLAALTELERMAAHVPNPVPRLTYALWTRSGVDPAIARRSVHACVVADVLRQVHPAPRRATPRYRPHSAVPLAERSPRPEDEPSLQRSDAIARERHRLRLTVGPELGLIAPMP